jgi:uncharacterized protein (DUF1501 family)
MNEASSIASEFETACPEFQTLVGGIDRRNFMKTVMALGGGFVLTGIEGLTVTAAAVGDARSDVIITVYMRGGMDGLMAVPVLGDAKLATLRPTQRVKDSAALNLDNHFGLHPNLSMLKELYDAGELAVVHSAGTPIGTRSHFDDQKALEYAAYDRPGTPDGWQNRYLQALGTTDVFAGYSTGFQTPVSFRGSAGTAVFENLGDVALGNIPMFSNRGAFLTALKALHSNGASNWQVAAQHSLVASERLRTITPESTGSYPKDANGNRFSGLAAMMKSGLGIKTANIEFDGNFDVHADAGVNEGTMANNFKSLSDSIRAFKADIGDLWKNVTIVTVTEFGRRLEENASRGFDHGWASAMFVMGGGVKGGKVVTKWPGLSDNRDGDLKVTIDYRDVLAEIMRYRGGIDSAKIKDILPDFKYQDLGLVRQLA